VSNRVPGFLLAGTHSGCGKTTLAAGLLRAFRNRGLNIAPFKAGPDYLDPMLHAVAAGRPSWNLDGWFLDDATLRETYGRGAFQAELALVEGVMGLFDGAEATTFHGSSAELAKRLGLPIVLVVDGSGVGGSVAATVLGHAKMWPDLDLAGVILNRLSGPGHFALQRSSIEAHTDVPVLGWAAASPAWRLPERHLGIFQPQEIPGIDAALNALGQGLTETMDLDRLSSIARVPEHIPGVSIPVGADLSVAVARDEAFNFIYADSLDRMARLGVQWIPFSPLRDRLPEGIAGLYLPGGYPELHASALSASPFLADLRSAQAGGLPIFAECGGYMVLCEALVDVEGRAHPMAGILPGRCLMTERLQSFGYKRLTLLQDSLFGPAGSEGKAHEFHHSIHEGQLSNPAWVSTDLAGNGGPEGHAKGNLLASYAHVPFGANPGWAEAWAARMRSVQ
jgi:cobyrinic acid a,c-diamide synthase